MTILSKEWDNKERSFIMWNDEYIGIREMGRQRKQQQQNDILETTEAKAHNNE